MVTTVEDYRPGYPQFSALVGSHASFHVCRRFLRVRARLLLLKQDELSSLESQLDCIDHDETREIFLGNRRRDTNGERREILEKLDAALTDYGMFHGPAKVYLESECNIVSPNPRRPTDALLDRNSRIFACSDPSKECVTNLRNWVDNKCSLARCETAYLADAKDLMTILSTQDDAVARLVPLIERILRSLYKIVGKVSSITLSKRKWLKDAHHYQRRCDISRDPNISIFSAALLRNLTRTLIAWFVVVSLLVPIVIINALSSLALRMAIIVVASAILITALSSFTNAKTVELFVSGAT